VSERQVDQETVAIVQPAEDECRHKEIEDGRRYAATNCFATDARWQSRETLSVARGSSSSDLYR